MTKSSISDSCPKCAGTLSLGKCTNCDWKYWTKKEFKERGVSLK